MACPGFRTFNGDKRSYCILDDNHLGRHFDECAHWEDETTVIVHSTAGFRYEYDERRGWRHIGVVH